MDRIYLDPERRRCRLDGSKKTRSRALGGVSKDSRPGHVGCKLLEQLQPFPTQAVFEVHEPGRVAAWSRKTIHEAGADRIADDRKHNRYGAGSLQQWLQGRGTVGEDDIG